jgi:uncharacterized protein YecE (DUF72 family)
MTAGTIHIGTSGWVYSHWRGFFYPAKLPQRSWLEYYAQHFDCTEINGSFYRLPSKATVLNWEDTVGAQFRFCPKISRFITHAKKLNDPEQAVPRFFDAFGLIAHRTGPILIQLPAKLAFHQDKARHASWTGQAALDLLEKFRIGWVIGDSGRRFASANAVTARHIYLRFHGPDGSYATGYSKRRLASFADRFRDWRDAGHTVWAFFNNDIHGYAIRDALALKGMVA